MRSLQRSREYQHNSWIGALMNREMLLEVDDPKRFFASIGACMAYLGTPGSYLCLFEQPLRVEPGTIPDFPERIHVCMRQEGRNVVGYSWDEAPVLYRNGRNQSFTLRGSFMTFLLFDEEYQYGVLNVEIDPEKIEFYYMLSLDIGTSLRYMDVWTQQKQYRAQLQVMARTDGLTGLYNRAGLIGAQEALTADGQLPAAVIMADLDHLKQINDHFGHREGDIALKNVADILRQVFGGDQVIGRIGGDEFQACFVQMGEDEIVEKLRAVREACRQYNARSDRPYFLEISTGYAMGMARTAED
jgi:diguanylate cyclase (GGDEF)-like protein